MNANDNVPAWEREKIAYDRLVAYVLAWRGVTDINLTAAEMEKIGHEIDGQIERRLTAGTLGVGTTDRECLEDAYMAAQIAARPSRWMLEEAV